MNEQEMQLAEFVRDMNREDGIVPQGITRTSWSLERVLDEDMVQQFERIYGNPYYEVSA